MDKLAGIESRTSALKLAAPGPSREQIETIVRAGARAPDHGRLRPWRFVVLEGDARARLGDAMAAMTLAKYPNSTPEQLNGERAKPMRAPTIVALGAKVMKGKIPEIEQVMAVAAAAQNMMLAAHALGYGAMWKTGGAAYDTGVKALLGLAPEDHIVGFIYLGTIATAGPLVVTPPDVRWL